MKTIWITAMVLLGSLAIPMLRGSAWAFHEGGQGFCEGCHISNGLPEDQTSGSPQLRGSDPSSTCLRCHADQQEFCNVMSQDGSSYTPGGDFCWLTKTFVWNLNGRSYRSASDNHGHNIVAVDYGLTPDGTWNSSPGGSYPSGALGCNSCHNPHGTTSVSAPYEADPPPGTEAGNFRLLRGVDDGDGDPVGGIGFIYPSPVAVAAENDWTETDVNHTAYGSGMSEWCGNCHAGIVNSGHRHPAGKTAQLTAAIISNYNAYMATGLLGGSQATSYLSLVPFEVGTTAETVLYPSRSSGPAGSANVMCLTCHRAHASAFENVGRWDFQTTFIANSHPKAGDGGVTGNDVLNSYYGRDMTAEFGMFQRQLCNKCHLQD